MTGNKVVTSNAWFAFVPILNILLLLEIARRKLWWIVLFLVPIVNIIVSILVCMEVADRMNKPS